MNKYSIIRADRIEPGRKGHAVSDASHESFKFFDTFGEAQAHCRLVNTPAPRKRRNAAQAGTGQARHQRNADRIDGYDRDDLGESPDY